METNIEIPKYLTNPPHKLTVDLIGVGGTGGWVLGDLVALHHYLVETGKPGLHVKAYDGDIVTEANLGRQNFNEADLGENKAIALIEKYNRYWGLNWESDGEAYDPDTADEVNITICCVDTVALRQKISLKFQNKPAARGYGNDARNKFILIDCGNGYDYGQVIVTRYGKKDKTFNDFFPNEPEKVNEHSCSILESLGKQNLFINKFIANLAVNWLYEGLRTTEQTNLGYFFNFNGLTPIS